MKTFFFMQMTNLTSLTIRNIRVRNLRVSWLIKVMSSITTNNLKHDLYDLTLKFRPEERETLNKIDAVYVA